MRRGGGPASASPPAGAAGGGGGSGRGCSAGLAQLSALALVAAGAFWTASREFDAIAPPPRPRPSQQEALPELPVVDPPVSAAAVPAGARDDEVDAADEPDGPGEVSSIVSEVLAANVSGLCRRGLAAGEVTFTGQKVGASIAVHPPRFYAVAQLLEEYVTCPAAVEALRLFLVFSSEEDVVLFRAALRCLNPTVPNEPFVPVVVKEPWDGWRKPSGFENQFVAAYKKWFGVMHMLDMGSKAPEYGLMLDAELLLYERHAPEAHLKGCGKGSAWEQLVTRIRRVEASKEWVAARVSETLKVYKFGNDLKTGKSFDQLLIGGNANFITKKVWREKDNRSCSNEHKWPAPECKELRRQYDDGLFTWWTDLPWMNLSVVSRMITYLVPEEKAAQFRSSQARSRTEAAELLKEPVSYREMSTRIRFHRFEHIGYQQWTVLEEGWRFRDVTNLTGEAKWGSYLEDPQPGARLFELAPMWISGHAFERAEKGVIVGPPADEPPLLIFHSDHGSPRKNFLPMRKELKKNWGLVCEGILKMQGRQDWNAKDIER